MSSILYNLIHATAESYWDKKRKLTALNYKEWVVHWFDVAEKVRNEFYSSGLVSTAEAVQNIIDEQKRYCASYLDEKPKEAPELPPVKEVKVADELSDQELLPDDFPVYGGVFVRR